MTSFLAWVAADSRGPTSLYFASDSRVSWRNDVRYWDTARKLFATNTTAEIFGFTGYVLLPQLVLARVCDFIDRGFRVLLGSDSPENRAAWLMEIIYSEVKNHPPALITDNFSILYSVRTGQGMPSRSKFHLYRILWEAKSQSISCEEIEVPNTSSILLLDGSGVKSMEKWACAWRTSDQGNTSRTLFSGFCDSLVHGADPLSGGEPQLVGLYRLGNAKVFGIVTDKGASLEGFLNLSVPLQSNIEWRDRLFQRVTCNGKLLDKAQRHAQPKNVLNPLEPTRA